MPSAIHIKPLYTFTGHNASVYRLQRFDNTSFLSAGGDGWIVKWDIEGEKPELGKLIAKTDSQIFSLYHKVSTSLVVAGDMHGELHFIDLDNQDNTRRFTHHKKGVFGIYRVGEYIYTLGGEGMMSKWNSENVGTVESIQLSDQSLRSIVSSATTIYVGSSDRNIYILDRTTEQVIEAIKLAHENTVFSLAFDEHRQFLLSGGRDAMLNIWTESNELSIYKGVAAHLFTINDIKINPSGKLFATASRDKTIKIWDARSYKLLKVIEAIRDKGHVNSVNHLLWLSESILISCSDDRTIKIWEVNFKE